MSTVDASKSDIHPPILELHGVTKEFPVRSGILRRVRGHVHAVSNADLQIRAGETVGLVGESGSGSRHWVGWHCD